MIARLAAALLALLLTAPAIAQGPPPAPVKVAIETSAGRIVVQLEPGKAPVTTANFLRYVDAKRFDGIAFYRAMKLEWGAGLIQAGQRDPKKLYPPIKHEPTTQTGLTHTEGTISMARFAPGTATADFTIMVGDMTGLDAKPAAAGDNLGFAAFGKVIEGMDVVKAIWSAPTSPTLGEGPMKGQMLQPVVRVTSVRRVA
jgi:peptidyl-prolyl cis-trans isomerase A (cyclophilin A)